MSDRTQGSVRTGSRPGDDAAPQETTATATQSIPTTGAQRAQVPAPSAAPDAAAAGAAPVDPVHATGAQAAPPTGAQPAAAAGAPPVPTAGPATAAPGGVATAARPTASTGKGKGARGPRRARLQLRHIDTWSALKISLVLSIALFFIWMVAVGILYGVLSGLGVFETLNDLFGQLGSASGAESGGDVITPGIVFGGAAVIGAINIVLMTALCTVAAFIYNMCSDLVGGLEITLSERD